MTTSLGALRAYCTEVRQARAYCDGCGATGLNPYMGDSLIKHSECGGTGRTISLADWAKGLAPLVEECGWRKCRAGGVFYSWDVKDPEGSKVHYARYHTILDAITCPDCQGVGNIPLVWQPVLRVALRLGWACCEVTCPQDRVEWIHVENHGNPEKYLAIYAALDAVEAYLKHPTDANREACHVAAAHVSGIYNQLLVACYSRDEGERQRYTLKALATGGRELGTAEAGRLALEEVEKWGSTVRAQRRTRPHPDAQKKKITPKIVPVAQTVELSSENETKAETVHGFWPENDTENWYWVPDRYLVGLCMMVLMGAWLWIVTLVAILKAWG